MKNKNILVSTLMFIIPISLGVCFYGQLPDEIPVHFNASGVADGFSNKTLGLFGFPFFLLAFHVFTYFMLEKDPKSKNMPAIMKNIAYYLLPFISTMIVATQLYYVLAQPFNTAIVIMISIGILFIALGNYLPKVKSNYTMGIRTPWTLANEEVWYKTHRLGGLCFVIAGLFFLASCFYINIYITVSVIALLVIVPFAYSYLLYKKINNKK